MLRAIDLTITESIGEPTHRHDGFDRRGVRCVVGEHLRGELLDRMLLHLSVLELTQAVLQLLEVVDERALRRGIVQCREYLQRVTQFLAPLAKAVQLRGW